MKKLFQIFALLGLTTIVNAGGTYTGTFQPYWWGDGFFIKPISIAKAGAPACATRALLRLPDDTSTDLFKYKYSILLSAWMANKSIQLQGTGACSSEGDEWINVVNYPN